MTPKQEMEAREKAHSYWRGKVQASELTFEQVCDAMFWYRPEDLTLAQAKKPVCAGSKMTRGELYRQRYEALRARLNELGY